MMRLLLIAANIAAPICWVASGFALPAFLAMFGVHALSLRATLVPGCSWWGPLVTGLDEGRPEVWLTIDDGPDGEHTREALDLLERHEFRATFFFVGSVAEGQTELVKEVAARGHGVGNHTRNHPAYSFWRLGPRRLRAEIEGGGDDLREILGAPPKLFRAPAGMRNLFVHPILKRLGLTLVAWSVRGLDGTKDDVDAIVGRIEAGLRPGAIVLLHEGRDAPDGGRLLLEVLPRVIAAAESRGLKMVLPDRLR